MKDKINDYLNEVDYYFRSRCNYEIVEKITAIKKYLKTISSSNTMKDECCGNCLHSDVEPIAEPKVVEETCSTYHGSCSECEHMHVSINHYPCEYCKPMSDQDMWEPKRKEERTIKACKKCEFSWSNLPTDKDCYNCKYHPSYNYEEKCKNCIDRNWEPNDDDGNILHRNNGDLRKRFEGSTENPLHCVHHVKQWDSSNCYLSFETCDGSEENCCCFLTRHPHEKVGYDDLVKLLGENE